MGKCLRKSVTVLFGVRITGIYSCFVVHIISDFLRLFGKNSRLRKDSALRVL